MRTDKQNRNQTYPRVSPNVESALLKLGIMKNGPPIKVPGQSSYCDCLLKSKSDLEISTTNRISPTLHIEYSNETRVISEPAILDIPGVELCLNTGKLRYTHRSNNSENMQPESKNLFHQKQEHFPCYVEAEDLQCQAANSEMPEKLVNTDNANKSQEIPTCKNSHDSKINKSNQATLPKSTRNTYAKIAHQKDANQTTGLVPTDTFVSDTIKLLQPIERKRPIIPPHKMFSKPVFPYKDPFFSGIVPDFLNKRIKDITNLVESTILLEKEARSCKSNKKHIRTKGHRKKVRKFEVT